MPDHDQHKHGIFHRKKKEERKHYNCSKVPPLVSAFVDTFVDYVVGGQFLQTQQRKSLNTSDKPNIVSQGVRDSSSESDAKQNENDLPPSIPAPERLIAIGDIHGDFLKAEQALLIAGVMDNKHRWIGGKTVVVQVGDLLDRGDDEIKVIYLLENLKLQAQRDGGDVHIMTGNHEVMNAQADLRMATPGGVADFQRWADWYQMGNALKERCEGLEKPCDCFKDIPEVVPCALPGGCTLSDGCKARIAALRPGGPISSRFLADHPTILIVGTTLFVHGGLSPGHIEYGLQRINAETKQWLQGNRKWRAPKILCTDDSPVWMRELSLRNVQQSHCEKLQDVLSSVTGAKRLVMGHTIQTVGITAACSNQAVRVDVGMSRGCINGAPEVLEIRNDTVVEVLSASSAVQPEKTVSFDPKKKRWVAGPSSPASPTSPTVGEPVIPGSHQTFGDLRRHLLPNLRKPESTLSFDKLKEALPFSPLTPPAVMQIPYPAFPEGHKLSSKGDSPVGTILHNASTEYMRALQRCEGLMGPRPLVTRLKDVKIMRRDIADTPQRVNRAPA